MGKRIAMMGTGALGGYVGAYFAHHGQDVTLIDFWPEHLETIRTRGIAREFGDRNIRANCIAPGQMNTVRAAGRTAPVGAELVPLGRKGDAEEIATVVRFLCGPALSYVNGQSLQINGGQMMF